MVTNTTTTTKQHHHPQQQQQHSYTLVTINIIITIIIIHNLQIWLVKKHPVWHTKPMPMQHGTTPHVVPKKNTNGADPPHTIKETASNIQPIVVPLISWDNFWQRNAILNRNGRVM